MLTQEEVLKKLENDKPIFLTLPEGVFRYPTLTKPDDKYKKYSVKSVTEGTEETENIGATMQQIADFAYEQAKAKLEEQLETAKGEKKVKAKKALAELKKGDIPMVDDVDDDGEPTGSYVFNASMPSERKDKDTGKIIKLKPGLFDSSAKPIPAGTQIWGGSKGFVSVMLRPYYVPGTGVAGCSLRLRGVQITDLVSGGGGDASSMGFKAREGGYQAAAAADTVGEDDEAEEKSDGDSSGDDEDF